MKKFALALLSAVTLAAAVGGARAQDKLLNVSYDPTREFYAEYNKGFAGYWENKTHRTVTVDQSHGGSGKQARAVIDGNGADVVTLSFPADIDAIEKAGLIKPGWGKKFAFHASPYTSTIVFVVRKGNPKGIQDWPDLIKPGVGVITPNPKTGGGARWNYLAAWGFAQKKYKSEAAAKDFVTKLYQNVVILDSGARGSTNSFVQREQGDVFISWENEAYLIANKLAPGKYEIITPSTSILAEAPVAVVDANVDAHGTRELATDYLNGLYSKEAQSLAAKYYYRPRITKGLSVEVKQFPKIPLFTIDYFGGWDKAQSTHFDDGGTFDQIFTKH
ncbi:MAG TPA: sulfate ABC transporter substrate-binding protein [Capsulimonadaceae bacterium]|jgi:sulfate transport system substrate-binding protein